MTIGIIGLGSFGQFTARVLANQPDIQVIGYDAERTSPPPYVRQADLAAVAKADYVVLAVPFTSYGEILLQLRELLDPSSVLVDVCSVKVLPERSIRSALPDHQNLLFVHPLFGPQSAPEGTVTGQQLIVTAKQGQAADLAVDWCKKTLGLKVISMNAKEHDCHMAQVHVLTFFVARGLNLAGIAPGPFDTPSYHMLLDLVRFDQTHSEELFQTIQQGNPYASEYRDKLVAAFDKLAASLKDRPKL